MAKELNITEELIAGRYQVTRHLGEGAMGSVYLAQDTQLHRQVALKVLRAEWVSRPEVAKRLEMECRIMAQLGPHNHIVTLFDRVNHGESVVLVMEFVPGENVAAVLDRTREMQRERESSRKTTPLLAGISSITLTPDEAINIVLQCLSGLDYAHSRGVIHRDIKPANIMVSHDHNGNIVAKITDFGIGKALADINGDTAPAMTALTRAGGPGPGTPAYMAPEQIDQKRFGAVGPAADLYALGVSLYEMLSLGLPFEGSYTELMHCHTNVAPPDIRKLRPGLSGALAGVVLKSMSKQQADRYESAHRFKLELEAAARDPLPSYEDAPVAAGRRSPVPLIFAAIAAVALAAGGYLYMTGGETAGNDSDSAGSKAPAAQPAPPPAPVPDVVPAAGPPQAVEDARTAVGAMAARQKISLGAVPADKVPPEAARADAVWAEGETAYASQNWDVASAKYAEAKGLYESVEPALASLMATPPVDPASTQPDPQPDPGVAEFHAAKNSANGAREGAKGRFGGKEPTGSTEYNAGATAFAQAEDAAAKGDYAGARALLVKAEQSFGAAKPAPAKQASAPKKPATTTAPAQTATTSSGSSSSGQTKTPAKKPGGFSAGQTTVTHTKE